MPAHTSTPNQRILCLWLPNWSIQRLVVSQPELRRQRIVLYRQDPRRGQLVSAASPLALRDSVCLEMPLSEAKSLLKRTSLSPSPSRRPKTQPDTLSQSSDPPAFYIFEHEPAADLQVLEKLADSLEVFSPIVGLEQVEVARMNQGGRTSLPKSSLKRRGPSVDSVRNTPVNPQFQPSSIFLDITGLAHLFGGEHQLAIRLRKHCDHAGYLTRIAIANTVGLAWGVARFLYGQQDTMILPPDDRSTFQQLPVAALRLSTATLDTLHQLGIETVEQLLRLPRADLAMRLGDEIHWRLDQATGQIDEPVIARHKSPEFQAEQILDYPTNHRETIEVIIAKLVTELCQQMRGRQQGALQWSIQLACQAREPLDFSVSLFQPTASLTHIMPLIEMQLEQLLQPHTRKSRRRSSNPAKNKRTALQKKSNSECKSNFDFKNSSSKEPSQRASEPSRCQFYRYTTIQIQEISVSVTSSVLLAEQQRQLFDENPRLDKQVLAHLINRLSSRLGQHNVVYPKLRSGAQPEHSFRFQPLVDIHHRRSRKKTTSLQQSHVIGRPLRLFQNPIPMEPADKTASDSPPQKFHFKQQPDSQSVACVMTRYWGPERIETGWWRGLTVCRDYWRMETETQQHLWIFQDLRNQNWYLHGKF